MARRQRGAYYLDLEFSSGYYIVATVIITPITRIIYKPTLAQVFAKSAQTYYMVSRVYNVYDLVKGKV